MERTYTAARRSRLVDELFLSPVIPVTRARDVTGVMYPTARADLRALERMGIVQEIENLRPITYECLPIMDPSPSWRLRSLFAAASTSIGAPHDDSSSDLGSGW